MYYVIELQTNDQGAALVNTYASLDEALARYHYILSFAATSENVYHSCMVVDEIVRVVKSDYFMHPKALEETK